MSTTVTVREVNQHTSAVLQRVSDGEELVVTKDGQPTARLIPFRARETYDDLVATGKIIPAKAWEPVGVTHIQTPPGVDVEALLTRVLDEERADVSLDELLA